MKLSNVQNFIKEKAELETKLNEHLKKIENLKEENQKNIYELEKSNLVEKKRLKSEMMEKLNDLAKEFRNAFHQQIRFSLKVFIDIEIIKLLQNSLKFLYFTVKLQKKSLEKIICLILKSKK